MTEFTSIDKKDHIDRLMGILDAPVNTVNGLIPAFELGWRFCESEYGKYMMDNQPFRFAQYFGYDSARMEEDLGTDVLPLHHQLDNSMYVAWIIAAELEAIGRLHLDETEVGIAVFAALVHDMGESTHPRVLQQVGEVVGYIPHGEKTDHNREVEKAVREFMYNELFSDVDPAVIARIEALISHQEESVLHDILEAAHTLQAFETGTRAGFVFAAWITEIIQARLRDEPLPREYSEVTQLANLYNIVTERLVPMVRYWANRFVYVKEFAKKYEVILETFENS